jgi:hypothetical protein
MYMNSQHKRASKRLLVAAIGVATVSYVGTQSGCAPDSDASEDDTGENPSAYDDESVIPEVSEQALSTSGSELQFLPTSGNLLPPPHLGSRAGGVVVVEPSKVVLPPSGNLMAPPVVETVVVGIPVPPPSGNLMAPPVLEEVKAIGVPVPPPSGNLMAPPVLEIK